jgi:regulator of PEP synthase PpsR (kinase-PPPase family)
MISGTVLVASDATGETGEKVVRAALVQFFGSEKVRVQMAPHVLDDAAVRKVVEQAKQQKALLVYTIVAPPLRALVRRLADEAEINAYDLMSGLLLQMSSHFGVDPLYKAGLGHELDAEYFRRVEAVEFAVNNDDGREPRNLKRADIVLVGISRTSKTPTSQYIAHRGYKVSNVPLVMGIPLPKEIEQVDPRRVFGLLVDPSTLVEIRRTRMKHLGMEAGNEYGDIRRVRQELEHCRKLFADHPAWTLFDISGKAIEETATTILERYRERFESPAGGANGGGGNGGNGGAPAPANGGK